MTATHYPTLETLAEDDSRTPSWWASVARALDDLSERLAQEAAIDAGPTGTLAQAVIQQPALANESARIQRDLEQLRTRVRQLRRLVTIVAGSQAHAPSVADELLLLAAAEDRYRERARALVWDSLARDIGGER